MEEKKTELVLRLKTLEQALLTLEEALTMPFSAIVRDAAIQRFEYTFELTWKLFRKVARFEGVEVHSPRQAIRAAYEAGLLEDIDLWFELLEDRNRTSHTYNESTANGVFKSAGILPDNLRAAIKKIRRNYLR
ncbi:MAG: HI0074 family nucleotidyltransferase substrate-binding subunit [Bacillota bacterium]